MPGVAPISGATCEPVDLDLLAFAVAHDLGGNLGALHNRLPRVHVLAVAGEQHVVEGHLAAGLRFEQRDLDGDARLGAELGAAGRGNGGGHEARTLAETCGSVKGERSAVSGVSADMTAHRL